MENIIKAIDEILLSQDMLVPSTRAELERFKLKLQTNSTQADLTEYTNFMNMISDEYEASLALLALNQVQQVTKPKPKRSRSQQQQQQRVSKKEKKQQQQDFMDL